MSSLLVSGGSVNNDSSADRDLLLGGLRLAATRSRLKTTLFETLHIALRQKRTDCAGIIKRLKDENVFNEVPFLDAVKERRQ
jgi:hypothetical protein